MNFTMYCLFQLYIIESIHRLIDCLVFAFSPIRMATALSRGYAGPIPTSKQRSVLLIIIQFVQCYDNLPLYRLALNSENQSCLCISINFFFNILGRNSFPSFTAVLYNDIPFLMLLVCLPQTFIAFLFICFCFSIYCDLFLFMSKVTNNP